MAKNYSTNSSVVPEVKYANADIEKAQIIKENKGKSGIYRWTNLTNGKSYIGSSTDLGIRFRFYYNINFLSRNNMWINKALIKYGYSNFRLEILKYCEPSEAISREQYFLDLLKPDYNILQKAGSMFGFKHSEETIAKLKESLTGRSWTWTSEQKAKFKVAASQRVEVLDTITKETTVYPSMSEAGRSIDCTTSAIAIALKDQKEKGVFRLIKKWYMVFPNESKIAGTSSPSGKGLKRTWESNAHKVEVLDTLNGNKTVYGSIREAAVAIGCVHATIRKALKSLNENGVTRLIKKRFQVKLLDD